jgi:FkbM family methyltransferase
VKQWIKAEILDILGLDVYHYIRNYTSRFGRIYDRVTFRKYVTHHSYSGVSLSVHIDDREAANWYSREWPELGELSLLSSGKLNGKALVFEIGAHQGVLAMILGTTARRVVAVEANAHCVDVARRNISLNGIENVEVVHAACASKSGTLTFVSDHVRRGEGGEGKCTVPALTIDELSRRFGTPDVLYIDVEGYEVEVLRGACETLNSNPDIFIEVHAGCGLESFGGSVEQICECLFGFDISVSAPYEPFLPVPKNVSLVQWTDGARILADRFFLVAMNGTRTRPG